MVTTTTWLSQTGSPTSSPPRPACHFGLPSGIANACTSPSSLLQTITRLLETRRGCPALINPEFRIVRSSNPAVLAFVRGDGDRVLCLFNFAQHTQTTTLSLADYAETVPRELLGGAEFPRVPAGGDYEIGIIGHGFFWFTV